MRAVGCADAGLATRSMATTACVDDDSSDTDSDTDSNSSCSDHESCGASEDIRVLPDEDGLLCEALVMASNRRTRRVTRRPSEKAKHWQMVKHPSFQSWAREVAFTGRPQEVPSALQSRLRGRPGPLEVGSPEALGRSTSAGCLHTMPASPASPSSPSWQRDADGAPRTFVAWQDSRGRTGRADSDDWTRGCRKLTVAERSALRDSAKERASQQCMRLLMASLAQRQRLRGAVALQGLVSESPRKRRMSGHGVGHEIGVAARLAVGQEARRFDEKYAMTQEAIADRLCFRPPKRSNSVSMGQVVRAVHGPVLHD